MLWATLQEMRSGMYCNISSMGPDRLFSDRSRVCTPPETEAYAAGTRLHLLA